VVDAFIAGVREQAIVDDSVILLTADCGPPSFKTFAAEHQKQFINVGIAEANLVTISAGLAMGSMRPFAYSIASFLASKAFEQIRNDVCLPNLDVKLVGGGAGVTYSRMGITHFALDDIGILRLIPNLAIVVPADANETHLATKMIASRKGPIYLRLGGDPSREIGGSPSFVFGKADKLREGTDLTIACCGPLTAAVLDASEILFKQGIRASVVNCRTVKPLDVDAIEKEVRQTGVLIVVEDHNVVGGIGGAISEMIADRALDVRFKRLGFENYLHNCQGSPVELNELFGVAASDITSAAKRLLKAKREG
jgi:transketolase